jgi:hypothetical protein
MALLFSKLCCRKGLYGGGGEGWGSEYISYRWVRWVKGATEYVKLLYIPPPPISTPIQYSWSKTHVYSEYRIQNTEYRIKNTECRIQNTECRIQNAEYRMQNTECRIQNAEYRIQSEE